MCATSARGRWRATMGANVVIICENVAQYGNISLLKNAIEAGEFCGFGMDLGSDEGAVYAVLFLRPNMAKNGCHGEPILHDARREGIFRNQAAGSDEAVNLK